MWKGSGGDNIVFVPLEEPIETSKIEKKSEPTKH